MSFVEYCANDVGYLILRILFDIIKPQVYKEWKSEGEWRTIKKRNP